LDDTTGVSGHSFIGAVPFLSAAKMADNLWLKAGFYAASALPALSRINDYDHYPSQVFLGWWLAYLGASAVDRSQLSSADRRILVLPQPGGVAAVVEY
jgi:membrane-associated phospholipid phosphatase